MEETKSRKWLERIPAFEASLLELSAAFSACAVVTCVGSLRQVKRGPDV